ncbi:hypothetical protein BC936DRAFT_137945 [Jimgerdemannia flammicorona]|uniref:HAD-like domain-containing protein n=1 Tax=Jimgerdemannia flammicorona TaxID=994334 RepID=A0A433CWD1_9FUNG|nr:hypothetical protein BC936DRAFT_137945 [Jimgerdemannia flammicorona]
MFTRNNAHAQVVKNTFIKAGASEADLEPHFDDIFSTLYNRFSSKEGYELFPDVTSTLKGLSAQGVRMGIVSNTDERLAKVIVSLELDPYLDFVLLSAEFGEEKPSPRIFERAIDIANERIVATNKVTNATVPLLTAAEALHVGDDETKDYQGALSAGMNAVLINRARLSYEESAPQFAAARGRNPDRPVVVHSLRELLDINVEGGKGRRREMILPRA